MSLVQISGLTFAWPGSYDNVFENACIQWDTAWKLGLTGRNGRGKTTLLCLLQGRQPYRGRITASVDFLYFPRPVADPAAPVAALAGDTPPWRLEKELAALGLASGTAARVFGTLSQGEQTRVQLALLFLAAEAQDGYLLIDEPTNHLDAAGRAWLGRYLAGQKQGFVLVSHDRALLDEACDHMLAIERRQITVTRGNFSTWYAGIQARDAREQAENDRLQTEIGRLQAAGRRTADWSDRVEASKIGSGAGDRGYIGHKAAKMMKRAKVLETRQEKAIEQKKALLQNIEREQVLTMHPLAHPQPCLVRLENVAIRYGDKTVAQGVSFTVRQGERLALQGPNGSGKSSLLKLICGQDIPHTGTVWRAGGLLISYVPQSTEGLHGSLADHAAQSGVDYTLLLTTLRELGLERVQFEKDLQALSAGQRKKVLLARSLCEQAHLYIWDEPLNYIDLTARIQLEKLLQRYRPTLLFVEHDRAFADAIATGRIEL